MRVSSALSTRARWQDALDEVLDTVCQPSQPAPDLAMLFVSHDHVNGFERIAGEVCRRTQCKCLAGCTGESIVGTGREVEDGPALSLWTAELPGVTATAMHLRLDRTAEGSAITGWSDGLPAAWPPGAVMLLLGEPFSFPADYLLERLAEDQGHVVVVGGMASGASVPGGNRLFLDSRSLDSGAVAVILYGRLRLYPVVSQGCRPIGEPLVITRAERNIILQLGGKPAWDRLQEAYAALPTHEQMMLRQGLHVGRVVSEYQDRFAQGDFLVRNVTGVDQDSGAIAIGDYVRAGQTVQFHIRDEKTADDDLRQLLARARDSMPAPPPGGLLFTCNGRGTRLFSQPHHDAQAIGDVLGDVPLAGFFAQGELGPVAGRNFLHGFTACVALLQE